MKSRAEGLPVYLSHPAPEALPGWKASQREGHMGCSAGHSHLASSEGRQGPLWPTCRTLLYKAFGPSWLSFLAQSLPLNHRRSVLHPGSETIGDEQEIAASF